MSSRNVCVIVPVLNTRAYLGQCLDSLVAQTLPGIEVICVDNGSTDGSYEFLKDYATRRTNIVVMRHAQGRQGGARNAGIKRASGDYIGFVDSDDFVSPAMFEKLHAAIRRDGSDIAVCNMSLFFPDGEHSRDGLPQTDLDDSIPFVISDRPRLLRNLTICNKLFSRRLLTDNEVLFPEGHYHEDQFFVIASFLLAKRIVTVPEPLYFYRRQRAGSVNEHHGEDNLHVFDVMETVRTFLLRNGLVMKHQRLIDEVKVLKFLQLYQVTGPAWRRAFFDRMREEFRHLDAPASGHILSVPEHREYLVARRYGYVAHAAFLKVRYAYGYFRSRIAALKHAHQSTTRASGAETA